MIKRNRIGELWLISFCSYLLLFCVGLDNDPEKIEYTGIIRTPFRYYPDSVLVLSGSDS